MPDLVLVHGAWHGAWCWQRILPALRARGHRVFAVTLTGVGDRGHLMSPSIRLATHIDDVVAVIETEELTQVVLVGHSYGGMVITGVADRAAERVGRLVFLDAANPKNSESLVEVSPGPMQAARAAGRVIDGVELVLFPGTDPLNYYGVTDPDDIEWMKPKLTPHPWKCFEQKLELRNEAALWAIPQYHIVCTSTLAVRDPKLMNEARADGRLWEMDTGHDLMITEPQAVADALVEIAAPKP